MFSLASVTLALSVAAAQPAIPPAAQQGAAPAPNSTTICRFQTGPLAGQVRDFAGVTGFKPFAAGAPCTDGKDSLGVADRGGPSPSADRAGADAAATSYRCRFTAGPKTGQTAELQAPLDARPRPGGACADGQGSRGIVR
jgi:hypothetical protein